MPDRDRDGDGSRIEEVAARVGRTRDSAPDLTNQLSKLVGEQAADLVDFILDRGGIKRAG